MASKAGEVYIDVKTRGIQKAQSQLSKFASVATGAFAGFAGAQVLESAFRTIANSAKEIIDLANEQIKSETILASTLKATGQYSDDVYQSFLKSAQAIQSMTTYGDEELLPVMAQFARLGNLSANEIERATRLTTDLAAATGRDLRAAQQLVFYALQGNVGMLRRAGIELDQAIVKSGDISRIMGEIESKVGGSAEALANTFGGALKQIQNIIGDIKEDFGKAFLESPAMRRSFEYIREFFNYLREFFDSEVGKEWINGMAEGFERLLKSILPTVKALSDMSLTMAPLLALTPGIHGILAAMGTNFGEWYKNLKDMNTELGKFVDHMEEYGSAWAEFKRGIGGEQPKYVPKFTPQTTPTGGTTQITEDLSKITIPEGNVMRLREVEDILRQINYDYLEIQKVSLTLPDPMNQWSASLKIIQNQLELQKQTWIDIGKSMALSLAQGQDFTDVLKNALPMIGQQLGQLAGTFLPGGPQLWGFIGQIGGTLLGNLFGGEDKLKPNINLTQNININIGEGQISERAFWDNLVMRHILPSFERTGLTPAAAGGGAE